MAPFLVWLMIYIDSHPSVVTVKHSGIYGKVWNDYIHDPLRGGGGSTPQYTGPYVAS